MTTLNVYANGVTICPDDNGPEQDLGPVIQIRVHLDGGVVELYEHLWVLQEALDAGKIKTLP